jgi:hypothetical protein
VLEVEDRRKKKRSWHSGEGLAWGNVIHSFEMLIRLE